MTTEIPDVVRTTIAALRTAATWLPDEQRDMLYEAATVAENGGWEDACCPICQETWCDAGCPLEDLRSDRMRGPDIHEDALRSYTDASRAPMGNLRQMVGLLDGASPAQVALANTTTAVVERLEVGTRIHAILWPSFDMRPASLAAPCYRTASGAAVHVRPACRC